MCIEHEFHLAPSTQISAKEEQLQRRIFWQSYIMDRYSSTTLGRPLSIADSDIEVRLPAEIDDEDLEISDKCLDDLCPSSNLHLPTQMSIFNALVRLRQINSKIYTHFSREAYTRPKVRDEPTLFENGSIYSALNSFLSELTQWRRETPNFEKITCLYERQDRSKW